jgi:hypothetical protein
MFSSRRLKTHQLVAHQLDQSCRSSRLPKHMCCGDHHVFVQKIDGSVSSWLAALKL